MQGHHLHLLAQLNSRLQEQSRSHGSTAHGKRCRDHLGTHRRPTLGLEKSCGKVAHEGLPGPAHSKTRDRLDPDAVTGEMELNSRKEIREKQEAPRCI